MAIRNPPEIDNAEVLRIIKDLLDDGIRDYFEGGVSSVTVEDHLPNNRKAIKRHCEELVEAGKLVRVWGAGRETGQPRESYLPVGHEDASAQSIENAEYRIRGKR